MWEHGVDSLLHVANFAVAAGANLAVQSTLLIGGGLLIAWLLRSRGAALRSAVLRVPVIALVLCPVATLALSAVGVTGVTLGVPRASLQATGASPAPVITAQSSTPEPGSPPVPSDASPMVDRFYLPNLPDQSDPTDRADRAFAPPTATIPAAATLPEPPTPGPESTTANALAVLYCALTLTWAIACTVLLIRLLLAHVRMAYVRRTASRAPAALIDACAHFAGTMKVRAPLMLVSRRVHSPCLVGLLRPAILLPADSGDDTEAHHEVIVHELAHLARHDCAWNLLGRVVRAILCFQPLAWALTRRIEEVSDDVADDYVVRHGIDRQQYVRRLVDIAKRFQPASAEMAAGVGVVAFKSSLGRRVQRILDSTRALSLRIGVRAALAIAFLAACATVAGGLIGAAGDSVPVVPEANDEESGTVEGGDDTDSSQTNETEPAPPVAAHTAPIIAHNVELVFADPAARDESFHSAQGVGFALSFTEIDGTPVRAFVDVLLIGQCTYGVSFVAPEPERLSFSDGTTGQEFASEPWPADTKRFRKVVEFPVKYGRTEYTCPVLIELQRQATGPPSGTYWFCAYLSGKMPGGAGGRRFEVVNLDQQMEFRVAGDAGKKSDAVLGVDVNGDGRIDPAHAGGERFWLYDTFRVKDKTYRVTEVDPYLPRVVFAEVVSDPAAVSSTTGDATEPPAPLTRGRVSGIVTNAKTGEPVAGAFVAIDHSGDAGGANLGRLRDEGIYITAETGNDGRFVLDNVAFNGTHPFYVTCPGFVRHERQVPLSADEPDIKTEVALKPAARLNIAVMNADGTPYKGPARMRLEAADHRVFVPPKDDWPRYRHNARPARDGALFTFGELDGGVFSVEAFAMAEKVPAYIGKMTSIELADGETKRFELRQAVSNSKLLIRIAPDPFKIPDNPLVVLLSRHASDLMWTNRYFYHPEDHRLGRVMEHALITVQAGADGVAVIDNPPPEAFTVIVMGVGQYKDIKNLGVYLRGARVEVATGQDATVEIPWVEPRAPGHVKTYCLGNTVTLEPNEYPCEVLCAMLTSATGDRVRFLADPAIQNETANLGAAEMQVWDVIESLHESRGWIVTEGEGDTFVVRPGAHAAAADLRSEDAEPVQSLQSYAEQLLLGSLGSIVVLNADTGAVLAMATAGIEDAPNKAYQATYPPGSLFKVPLAIAALEEGLITCDTHFGCNGYFRLQPGGRPWRCWRAKYGGHGSTNILKALYSSCDVYFYNVAMKLGVDRINQWAERLGLGVPTGINLPDEAVGLIPSREWKQRIGRENHPDTPAEWEWYDGETLNLSIGQHATLTTPLQNAVLMAAVVNGGRRVYPHTDPTTWRAPSEPLISDETLRVVQEGMRLCVEKDEVPSGTGRNARVPGVTVIGKTGTSQAVDKSQYQDYETERDIPYELRDHALFIGGVLDREPRIAVSVVVGHGLHGSSVAAPLAGAVIKAFYGVSDEARTAPANSQVPGEVLAWQSTDTYVPPDPMYFPDNPEGGKALDILFDAVDKDTRPDNEVLTTVRNGLRRTRQHQTLVLRWIGNRYIWGKDQQNPEAIELMYHAVPLQQHYAIYFGLSVVKEKSPNILKTLADIAMATDDPNDLGRIAWGCDSQKDELIAFLEPYLASKEKAMRDKAAIRERIFKGELKAFEWARAKDKEEAEATVGDRLPEFRDQLLNTKGKERLAVLKTIQHNGVATIMDSSFLDALSVCAEDELAEVRRAVARMAGGKWVWGADKQHPDAIDLMLRLSRDDDRDTRNAALYYGLSTVKDKQEPVIRRLIEMALADHDPNQYGRVTWGITAFKTAPKRVEKVMGEFLDGPFPDAHAAASVYFLYKDLLQEDPPNVEIFAAAIVQYPDDLIDVRFGSNESFKPVSEDALWHEFAANLPEGLAVDRGPGLKTETGFVASALVHGKSARDATVAAITANPRLQPGPARPVTPQMQLFHEERGRGTSANPPRIESGAHTEALGDLPLAKLQQAANQIYKDERYRQLQQQTTAYVAQIGADKDAMSWHSKMRAAYRAIADYDTFFAELLDDAALRPILLAFWRAMLAERNPETGPINDEELVAFVGAGLKRDADHARKTLQEAQQAHEWPSYVTEYLRLWATAETLLGGAQSLAKFQASQVKPAEPDNAAIRVLHFPEDNAVGEVIIADPGIFTTADPWWPGSMVNMEEHFGPAVVRHEARGDLVIPPGKEAGLWIDVPPGAEPPSWLVGLEPDDLTHLSCFVHGKQTFPIERLTGLKVLRLSGGLSGDTIRSLSALTVLERLRICSQLDPADMAAISDLSGLTGLHLNNPSRLSGEAMAPLRRLKKLQELHLLGSFDEAGLAHVAALPNLRRLRLVVPGLSAVGLAHLSGIQNLEELNVDDIASADMLESISRCIHLKKLILRDFRNSAGLGHLSRLPELKSLEVVASHIDDEVFMELGELRNVKKLVLSHRGVGAGPKSVTNASLRSLSAVKSLESLEFRHGHGRFTDEGLVHIAKLKNLRELVIPNSGGTSDSGFTDAGLAHLAALEHLETLHLRGDDLTDASMAHIARLKALRSLELLIKPNVTDQGLATLANMPGLQELKLGKNTVDLAKYRSQ